MSDNPNIIETIARAIEPDWFGEVEGKHILDNYPGQHKSKQEAAKLKAAAVLTALEQSGHAIVPIEPTEEMEEAARDVPFIAMGNGDYLEPDRSDIYRAMIQVGKVKP